MHNKDKKAYAHLHYNSYFAECLKVITYILFGRYIKFSTDTSLTLKSSSEPFLLLAPHATVWDPPLIGYSIQRKLHYTASDIHFHSPFLKRMLQQLGTITKKENISNLKTIREIMYVLHILREPVCIFPEGANTWDGTNLPILKPIVKLVKMAKIPVVTMHSPHAHLIQPRWATQRRKVPITITYSTILTTEQITNMDEHALYKSITNALCYNTYDQQREMPIIIHSNHRSEYLERVLFFCPHCYGTQQIISKGNYVYCLQCCNIWHVSVYGFLHLCKKPKDDTTPIILHHDIHPNKISPANDMTATDDIITPVVWNTWQQQFMEQYLDNHHLTPEQPVFLDKNFLMFTQKGHSTKKTKIGTGTFMLNSTTVQFKPHTSPTKTITMSVNTLKGINVQNNERLEYYYDDVLYTIQSKYPQGNTYKYMCAIQYLQQRTIQNA